MTDSGTEGAPRLDTLLAPGMARRADETGINKARMAALGARPRGAGRGVIPS